MNFEKYQLNDFLMDESFSNWVKRPNGEDAKFWESWLKDHPEKIQDAEEAKKVIRSISFKDISYKKKEITNLWESISAETIHARSSRNGLKSNSSHSIPWNYLKVAAVFLPFIITAVLFLFYRQSTDAENMISQQLIEKRNPKGQKLTIFLSDGSKVKLNADSEISYLKPFDENSRVVELVGEAFFEVTPDKNRPFIVRSGKLETKVLGTSFNVKAYPTDNVISVAVKTGKVSVETKNVSLNNTKSNSIVLLPSEMATYSDKTKKTTISEYDPKEVLGWNEGTLYFNNASMQEFVDKLERWYGIDIEVKRDIPIKKGIVGEFHNQTLDEILMGTQDASEFEYVFKEDKVIIR